MLEAGELTDFMSVPARLPAFFLTVPPSRPPLNFFLGTYSTRAHDSLAAPACCVPPCRFAWVCRYEKIGDVHGRGPTPVQVRILQRALKGVKVSEQLFRAGSLAGAGGQRQVGAGRRPRPGQAASASVFSVFARPSLVAALHLQVKAKHNQFKKAIRSVCRGSPFEVGTSTGDGACSTPWEKQQHQQIMPVQIAALGCRPAEGHPPACLPCLACRRSS